MPNIFLRACTALLVLLTGCGAPQPQPVPPADAAETPITVTVGDTVFDAVLYDDPAAEALRERLPLTVDMSELNGNEKYVYLDEPLPTDAVQPGEIRAGDLMLYGEDCLVLFYESFSSGYRYTPLGRLDDVSGLRQAVGSGSVRVTIAARAS